MLNITAQENCYALIYGSLHEKGMAADTEKLLLGKVAAKIANITKHAAMHNCLHGTIGMVVREYKITY